MDCCPPPKRPQVLNRPVLHPSWASFRIVLPIVMLMECAPCATFPISTGAVVVPDLRFCGPWSKVAELDTPPSHPRRRWVQYWTESCPRAWHTSHLEAQKDRPVVSLKPLGCTRARGGGGCTTSYPVYIPPQSTEIPGVPNSCTVPSPNFFNFFWIFLDFFLEFFGIFVPKKIKKNAMARSVPQLPVVGGPCSARTAPLQGRGGGFRAKASPRWDISLWEVWRRPLVFLW